MTNNLDQIIRTLSETYDPDSDDTYVTVYFKKKSDEKFIDRRIKACRTILKKENLKNFDKTIEKIKNSIKNTREKNIAVFSSDKNNFHETIELPVDVENQLVVDSSPYIKPLARLIDEWESFTLLIVNSNYAKFYSVDMGKIEDTKTISEDIINRHKKGGQSQARFNRIRRGAINSFLKEVSEALELMADQRIIIAGPGISKTKLVEMLSKPIQERIIEIVDIDTSDENKMLKNAINIIREKEEETSNKSIENLKAEILKNGLAVYGITDTLQAVKNGQVELLIIEKDKKIPGWICENCQIVGKGLKEKCPNCSNNTSEVDVLEEILEFAQRTDAEIEFTDSKEISDLGHIGAILRYK